VHARVARAMVELGAEGVIAGFGSDLALRSGDVAAAARLPRRGIERVERVAGPFFHSNTNNVLAAALAEAGDWSGAIAAAERGLAVRRQSRVVMLEMPLLATLARAHLGAGDRDRARAAATEAMALCERFPEPRFFALIASAAVAHVLLRIDGDRPEALAALALAEALAAALPDRF
jgi:tetratricopeptide (TPR) repeat protein